MTMTTTTMQEVFTTTITTTTIPPTIPITTTTITTYPSGGLHHHHPAHPVRLLRPPDKLLPPGWTRQPNQVCVHRLRFIGCKNWHTSNGVFSRVGAHSLVEGGGRGERGGDRRTSAPLQARDSPGGSRRGSGGEAHFSQQTRQVHAD